MRRERESAGREARLLENPGMDASLRRIITWAYRASLLADDDTETPHLMHDAVDDLIRHVHPEGPPALLLGQRPA